MEFKVRDHFRFELTSSLKYQDYAKRYHRLDQILVNQVLQMNGKQKFIFELETLKFAIFDSSIIIFVGYKDNYEKAEIQILNGFYSRLIFNFVGSNATGSVFFGTKSMDWGLIDRWNKNYSVSPFDITIKHDPGRSWNQGYLISPPNYTLYTYFRLRDYFIIFLIVLAIHILAIFISKWKTSNIFVNNLNFLDKFMHCVENTNIASNVQEWDDGKGDALAHKKRMEANLKETVIVIWIKTFFNIVLLMPICYLGKYKTFFKFGYY